MAARTRIVRDYDAVRRVLLARGSPVEVYAKVGQFYTDHYDHLQMSRKVRNAFNDFNEENDLEFRFFTIRWLCTQIGNIYLEYEVDTDDSATSSITSDESYSSSHEEQRETEESSGFASSRGSASRRRDANKLTTLGNPDPATIPFVRSGTASDDEDDNGSSPRPPPPYKNSTSLKDMNENAYGCAQCLSADRGCFPLFCTYVLIACTLLISAGAVALAIHWSVETTTATSISLFIVTIALGVVAFFIKYHTSPWADFNFPKDGYYNRQSTNTPRTNWVVWCFGEYPDVPPGDCKNMSESCKNCACIYTIFLPFIFLTVFPAVVLSLIKCKIDCSV